MHIIGRNVNDIFRKLVSGIYRKDIETRAFPSRYGDVIRIMDPVIITYTHPRERILFNVGRDVNPFANLFESLWMISGRNDLDPIAYFTPRFKEFSDDGGITQPDAYGYRWRKYFGWDQIKASIEELRRDPNSRRVVISMWDPGYSVDFGGVWREGVWCPSEESKFATSEGDFGRMTSPEGTKGVPCNLEVLFEIVDKAVNMTVFNRSNDLVLGALGANVVHFSFLQEYVACALGLEIGKYHQVTNNLHIYTNNWEPEKWLEGRLRETSYEGTSGNVVQVCRSVALFQEQITLEHFDRECTEFVAQPLATSVQNSTPWMTNFLEFVAQPMVDAFYYHKDKNYNFALVILDRVPQCDWIVAAREWIERRRVKWEAKQAQGVTNESKD